jgi:hypothetical protein
MGAFGLYWNKITNKSIWNSITSIILKLNYWKLKIINIGNSQLNDDFNKEKYYDKFILIFILIKSNINTQTH